MTKILIAYGTTDGHTARIAEYLADVHSGPGPRGSGGGPQTVAGCPRWMITTPSSSEAPSIWANMTSTFVTSFGEIVSRWNVFRPPSSR